jgi:hypothetical protein
LGGPLLANAAFTVFREQPTTRAISEIETPSDFRSRRISAHCSTISTCFLPGSTPARVKGKLVKIQLPHRGQYSVAADMERDRRIEKLVVEVLTAVNWTRRPSRQHNAHLRHFRSETNACLSEAVQSCAGDQSPGFAG